SRLKSVTVLRNVLRMFPRVLSTSRVRLVKGMADLPFPACFVPGLNLRNASANVVPPACGSRKIHLESRAIRASAFAALTLRPTGGFPLEFRGLYQSGS